MMRRVTRHRTGNSNHLARRQALYLYTRQMKLKEGKTETLVSLHYYVNREKARPPANKCPLICAILINVNMISSSITVNVRPHQLLVRGMRHFYLNVRPSCRQTMFVHRIRKAHPTTNKYPLFCAIVIDVNMISNSVTVNVHLHQLPDGEMMHFYSNVRPLCRLATSVHSILTEELENIVKVPLYPRPNGEMAPPKSIIHRGVTVHNPWYLEMCLYTHLITEIAKTASEIVLTIKEEISLLKTSSYSALKFVVYAVNVYIQVSP